jgi:hypothetical protein
MSCYDENFGKDRFEDKIAINVRRFQKQGPHKYAKRFFKKWGKRFKFYGSYRGSLRNVINRARKLFIKKDSFKTKLDREEIENKLKEIALAKEMLKEEARCHSRK